MCYITGSNIAIKKLVEGREKNRIMYVGGQKSIRSNNEQLSRFFTEQYHSPPSWSLIACKTDVCEFTHQSLLR